MRSYFLIFLLLSASFLQAQTNVEGTILDKKGAPIAGASLTIRDSYDGGITDSSGKFSFTTFEKGKRILDVSITGYKKEEKEIDLSSSLQPLSFSLREEINEMKAVVITAGSFEASDRKRATVLTSLDIVTTASANADITGAIKTLPGAQQVGESEGLFVRGGTAAETRTYIDGTLVNNFFYSSVPNISQRGRFSPFIFKGTVFSAGGYSALYGQALSSALILESIDLPEQSTASLGISPLGLSGGFQKLTKNKKASWGINYGFTHLAIAFKLIPQRPEYFQMPQYHTGDANFRIKTSATGMLKYYGYFSWNKLGVRNPSLDTLGYKEAFVLSNLNYYHNFSYRQNLGPVWKGQVGFSFANNRDQIRGSIQNSENQEVVINEDELREKNFGLELKGRYINGRLTLERRLMGLSAIRFGAEYNYSKDSSIYTTYSNDTYRSLLNDHLLAPYAEADIYLTNSIAAKFGARYEHSSLLKKSNIAPRISLAYKLSNQGQASLAYGTFYQNPERRYISDPQMLDFSKATHYIAQYQRVTALTTLRLEGFYKNYEGLVKTEVNGSANSNGGSGYAQGFEAFWRDKKSIKNFDYWISYSYLNTKRDFLNYPGEIEPSFAARHTANIVVKKFVSSLKTQFNANYSWASGRPYYNIRYDNGGGKYSIFDQGRTIPYNSLSLSVNYLPQVFSKGANKFTVFVLSVTNVLGSDQVFGYNYSYNGSRKQAIVPPSKVFVFIGAFLSFGVDRSQDVINSNL